MAQLNPATRSSWKKALSEISSGYVAVGLNSDLLTPPQHSEGMIGLIDWLLHGQVSRLLAKNKLLPGENILVPGNPDLQRPSFLFLYFDGNTEAKKTVNILKKLEISDLHLAESTFPEDFLGKMKQNFKKEGIRCIKVEPETQ